MVLALQLRFFLKSGSYFDRFEFSDGGWRFLYRDSQADMLEDLSRHIRLGVALLRDLDMVQK
jgi:hypothetical protein